MKAICLLGSLFFWMCALSNCAQNKSDKDKFKMECDEEPFRSMRLPIKHANAVVQHAQGNLASGDQAILIRIVDSTEAEYFLAVAINGSLPEYKAVIKNLPLKWISDSGPFGGITIPDNIQIPEDFFNGKRSFERISNIDEAISDLVNILGEFKDAKDGYSRIAYECLKKHRDR